MPEAVDNLIWGLSHSRVRDLREGRLAAARRALITDTGQLTVQQNLGREVQLSNRIFSKSASVEGPIALGLVFQVVV